MVYSHLPQRLARNDRSPPPWCNAWCRAERTSIHRGGRRKATRKLRRPGHRIYLATPSAPTMRPFPRLESGTWRSSAASRVSSGCGTRHRTNSTLQCCARSAVRCWWSPAIATTSSSNTPCSSIAQSRRRACGSCRGPVMPPLDCGLQWMNPMLESFLSEP